jgi:chemotaxis protein CheC
MTESEQIVDALAEFINIGAGKAANALNELFGSHTRTSIPTVTIIKKSSDVDVVQDQYTVSMNFIGEICGSASLVFASDTIEKIATIIGPGPSPEQSASFCKSVLLETANIVINAIIGSISNMVKSEVEYSVPVTSESLDFSHNTTCNSNFSIKALTTFTLENHNISTVVHLHLNDTTFVDKYLQKLK